MGWRIKPMYSHLLPGTTTKMRSNPPQQFTEHTPCSLPYWLLPTGLFKLPTRVKPWQQSKIKFLADYTLFPVYHVPEVPTGPLADTLNI